jgi:hypothetical protein
MWSSASNLRVDPVRGRLLGTSRSTARMRYFQFHSRSLGAHGVR